MKNNKKLVSLALCGMLAFGFSGCSLDKPKEQANEISGISAISLHCQDVLNEKLNATALHGTISYQYSETENGNYVAVPENYAVEEGEFFVKASVEADGEWLAAEKTVKVTVTHAWATEWMNNEAEHYHVCVCGAQTDNAVHSVPADAVWQDDTTGGKHYQLCECGVKLNEAAHSVANWETTDETHTAYCSCGKVIVNAEDHDYHESGVKEVDGKYYTDTVTCSGCQKVTMTNTSIELTPVEGEEKKYSAIVLNWLTMSAEDFSAFKTAAETATTARWAGKTISHAQLKGGQNGWWAGCQYGWDAGLQLNADGYYVTEFPKINFSNYEEVSFKVASVNTNNRNIYVKTSDGTEVEVANPKMTKNAAGQSNGGTWATFTVKKDGTLTVTMRTVLDGVTTEGETKTVQLSEAVMNGTEGLTFIVKGTGGAAMCMSEFVGYVTMA